MNNSSNDCQEEILRDNQPVIFRWHPGVILDGIPLHQVYGFSVTKEGLVTLVRDSGESRFTLPGGEINKSEDPQIALIREFLEEAQFEPINIKLLGSLEVINNFATDHIQKHHQEIRYACQVGDIENFIPNKNGFETEERIFVTQQELLKYVKWMEASLTGRAQIEVFKKYLKETNCL